MLILIMDGISKEILLNEKLLEDNFALYQKKAKELALLALSDKDKLNLLIGNSLLQELDNAKKNRDELLKITNENQALEAQLEVEKADVKKSRLRVVELEKQKKEILSRLGACALVQGQLDAAKPKVSALIKDEIEYEKEALRQSLSVSSIEKIKGKLKLSLLKKGQAKRVYKIGKLIDDNNLASYVKSDIASDLDKINQELNYHKGTFEHLTQHLEEKENEKLTTINYSERLEEADVQLNNKAISYGIYLFENGSKWICEDTPDEELDLLAEMLNIQKRSEEIESSIKQCHKEISIDELSLLIANDRKSIERLMIEKMKIEEEISKINEHIEQITGKIMEIKQHE